MRIGIIGAGFTGLTAAFRLSEGGHEVIIFEKNLNPGGLASGFSYNKWVWPLESHYHHLFTNDNHALALAQEVGTKILTLRPKTSVFYKNQIYQFDSPKSLIAFPHLPPIDKIRTGFTLFYLKTIPFWKSLEKISSEKFLRKFMGNSSWKILWQPLLEGKFGRYSNTIAASWFWARIKKRTPSLCYPKGGFLTFAKDIEKKIIQNGGVILFNTQTNTVEKKGRKIKVVTTSGKRYYFDKVISTLPFSPFAKTVKGLPVSYTRKINLFKGIGAVNLVLLIKNKFLYDGTYWLNICDRSFPFLSLVEHTNFMKKNHYDNQHILYIGNYLPPEHKYFQLNEKQLLNIYLPFLKKVNNKFSNSWVSKAWVFKAGFAQPIIIQNYSKKIPPFKTPIKNLYVANIQQVYPWDRGTNYAIEMGENLASLIMPKS